MERRTGHGRVDAPPALRSLLLRSALAVAAATACTPEPPPVLPDARSVLLVTLDTTRADRLGLYGYPGRTSPRLDALAREATVFESAIAQAAVTPVSHASILTGLDPDHHGLRKMHGNEAQRLPEERVTLAEVLAAHGYATAAFVSAFPVSERFGLAQGFQVFDADFMRDPETALAEDGTVNTGRNQRIAGETTDRALAWLERAPEPFFLWVHYFDPHDALVLPPEAFLRGHEIPGETREALRRLYDLEIRYMDAHLGRLLDGMRRAHGLDEAIVVVTADHGEGLGDHDWWTHGVLYQEQIRVPLVVKAPGSGAGARVPHRVRTIDVAPTVLELARVPARAWPELDGRSLVPLLDGEAADPGLDAYADALNTLTYVTAPGIRDRKDEVHYALLVGRWKYIHHERRPERSELYDLATDPREARNLLAERPDVVARMRERLARRRGEAGVAPAPLSAEERQRLRALGYVE